MVRSNEIFITETELINGTISTYKGEIVFINDMTGTADMMTENSRLDYRFIKPLNWILKK